MNHLTKAVLVVAAGLLFAACTETASTGQEPAELTAEEKQLQRIDPVPGGL